MEPKAFKVLNHHLSHWLGEKLYSDCILYKRVWLMICLSKHISRPFCKKRIWKLKCARWHIRYTSYRYCICICIEYVSDTCPVGYQACLDRIAWKSLLILNCMVRQKVVFGGIELVTARCNSQYDIEMHNSWWQLLIFFLFTMHANVSLIWYQLERIRSNTWNWPVN